MEIKQQQTAGPSSLAPLQDIHTDNAPVTDATSPTQTPIHPSLSALTPPQPFARVHRRFRARRFAGALARP